MRSAARRFASLAVLVAVAFATIATSQARPTARSELEFPVQLDGDNPIAAKRIRVFIDHGGNNFDGATLLAGGKEYEINSDLWVSVIPEDTAEPVHPLTRYSGVYAEHDLTEACDLGCERSYVVLARMRDASGAAVADSVRVDLTATYQGEGGEPPPGAMATITMDSEPLGPEQYTSLRVVRTGVLDVGDHNGRAEWSGELVVSGAALGAYDVLGFPVVGRMRLSGSATETGEFPLAHLEMNVGLSQSAFGNASSDYPMDPLEVDWLPECDAASVADCTVPIEISLTWSPHPDESGKPPPGSVRFEFELEVRLEYLDRSEPPPGAQLVVEQK